MASLQESGIPWTEAFARKLQGGAQLVAPTINCALVFGVGPQDLDGVHDHVPHVSWQVFAMSKVGRRAGASEPSATCCASYHAPHVVWQVSAMSKVSW